jgi:glycine cleavage system H protein
MNPSDRKYSKQHEWAKLEQNGSVIVGITTFAQEQLGDIVFIDLPSPGTTVNQFEKLGEVESVKAVSDIYSPISGEVTILNQIVVATPETVNKDPFEQGWMVKIKPTNLSQEMENLLSSDSYDTFIEGEAH